MATFVSQAPNLWISISLGGEHKTVRFNDGRLNTAIAAKKLGISESSLIAKLKENRYYGVRFWEHEEVRDRTEAAASPKHAARQEQPQDNGLPPYKDLVAKAQRLGLPYVGVKHEVLAEQVRQAEQVLGAQS